MFQVETMTEHDQITGQTMTEHDQPCFLVKRNHEITQSDLNKPFSFNMVKHILRWKTKHCIRADDKSIP